MPAIASIAAELFNAFCLSVKLLVTFKADKHNLFLQKRESAVSRNALWQISINCQADHPRIKAHWESIAKKFDGLILTGISIACGELALVISSPAKALLQCALCILC